MRVCVFCGSSRGSKPAYAEAATALGTALAASGTGLVYGGGDVGLMGVVADATLAGGGEVIGVMPDALVAKETVVLLDVDGYWDPFVALLDRAVDAGFLRAVHRDLARRAATATDALDLLTAPPPPATHKWIDRDDV